MADDEPQGLHRTVLAWVGAAGAIVGAILTAVVATSFGVVPGILVGGLLAAALVAGASFVPRLNGPRGSYEPAVTPEEIRDLVREGEKQGVLETTERTLIESVLKFSDMEVRRVMAPRPKITAISLAWPPDEVLRYAVENKFSRYPVYDKSVNDVVGFLYYKDLLPALYEKRPLDLRQLLRPPFFVPETMKLDTLLKEMQRRRTEMAVVVNEHGNVEGVVTLEDLLEQIVGPISDEYDVEERRVEKLKDGSWLVDASLVVGDLPPDVRAMVPPEEGYETVAGFALATLQRLPRSGETWDVNGWRLTVVEMDGRRIARLKVLKL